MLRRVSSPTLIDRRSDDAPDGPFEANEAATARASADTVADPCAPLFVDFRRDHTNRGRCHKRVDEALRCIPLNQRGWSLRRQRPTAKVALPPNATPSETVPTRPSIGRSMILELVSAGTAQLHDDKRRGGSQRFVRNATLYTADCAAFSAVVHTAHAATQLHSLHSPPSTAFYAAYREQPTRNQLRCQRRGRRTTRASDSAADGAHKRHSQAARTGTVAQPSLWTTNTLCGSGRFHRR